jgi:hypothetical protein
LPKFQAAPAIFPNNDVKFDVNKRRAREFVNKMTEAIIWAQAKHTPSSEALRDRPGMVADEIKWFAYHDQDCGKLYGMLPLIRGMPITLLDHIDRSPEKLL